MKAVKSNSSQQIVISNTDLEAYFSKYPTDESRLKAYVSVHLKEITKGVSDGYLKEEILEYSR